MKFEHLALNVPDAAAMAAWYMEHCQMQAVIAMQQPPYTHFLADSTGRTIAEIYSNPQAPFPDYASQHPLCLHVAFAVQNAGQSMERLMAAGAAPVSDQTLEDGTRLIMLRDPWGIALQLVQRAQPLP